MKRYQAVAAADGGLPRGWLAYDDGRALTRFASPLGRAFATRASLARYLRALPEIPAPVAVGDAPVPRGRPRAAELAVGGRVESRWRGGDFYFSGTVVAIQRWAGAGRAAHVATTALDATFTTVDVDYDDGEEERELPLSIVRPPRVLDARPDLGVYGGIPAGQAELSRPVTDGVSHNWPDVAFHRGSEKWLATLRYREGAGLKNDFVGLYDTELEAARMRDARLRALGVYSDAHLQHSRYGHRTFRDVAAVAERHARAPLVARFRVDAGGDVAAVANLETVGAARREAKLDAMALGKRAVEIASKQRRRDDRNAARAKQPRAAPPAARRRSRPPGARARRAPPPGPTRALLGEEDDFGIEGFAEPRPDPPPRRKRKRSRSPPRRRPSRAAGGPPPAAPSAAPRGPKPRELVKEVSRSDDEGLGGLPADDGALDWVCCDACAKWRKVPRRVFDALAKDARWTCADNEDAARDTCAAPEEAWTEPAHAWVCCDACGKWRKIPQAAFAALDAARPWYCRENVDAARASCLIPEDDWDHPSDDGSDDASSALRVSPATATPGATTPASLSRVGSSAALPTLLAVAERAAPAPPAPPPPRPLGRAAPAPAGVMKMLRDFRDGAEAPAVAPAADGAPAAGGAPAAAVAWRTHYDDEGTPYYHDPASGETLWAPPPGMAPAPPGPPAPDARRPADERAPPPASINELHEIVAQLAAEDQALVKGWATDLQRQQVRMDRDAVLAACARLVGDDAWRAACAAASAARRPPS